MVTPPPPPVKPQAHHMKTDKFLSELAFIYWSGVGGGGQLWLTQICIDLILVEEGGDGQLWSTQICIDLVSRGWVGPFYTQNMQDRLYKSRSALAVAQLNM